MIYSVTSSIGGWSGVHRFTDSLRTIWPDLEAVTPQTLPRFRSGDTVVADNHTSCAVPDDVPTIVVHHGCALSHFEKVPSWRTPVTAAMCRAQERMFSRPNRVFVAPSTWVRDEFCRHYNLRNGYARIVPHWVEPIPRNGKPQRPVVMSDPRDENKGSVLWRHIVAAVPEMDFRPLRCTTDAERVASYQAATTYLCLSASEGAPYAVADAEAAELLILSTNCGNVVEFGPHVIQRTASDAIEALRTVRRREHASFFTAYTRDRWVESWLAVVDRAREGCPPVCTSALD